MSQAKLYCDAIATSTASATSEAAGYPATNALTTQVLRPWRSTSTASNSLTLDFGSSKPIAAVAVNDVNVNNVDVYADNVATPTTYIGSMTILHDAQGRYKGLLAFGATVRYVRFEFSGSLVTSDAFYRVGFAGAFGSAISLARDPLYGESAIDTNWPQTSVALDNGQIVRDGTGPSYMALTLSFSGGALDDHEMIARRARAGLCWYYPGAQYQQCPVRHVDPKITRKLTAFNRESVQITLREAV